MRLVTIRPEAGDEAAGAAYRPAVVLSSGRLLTIGALVQMAPSYLPGAMGRMDLASILAYDPGLGAVRDALEVSDDRALEAAALDPDEVRLAAPIPRPGKIIGVGYNYLDHIREQGLERPARPVLFSMFANAVTPDGTPIRHPADTHALDLEAELAVVIGRQASRVAPHEAARCVAGYTAANDVTAPRLAGPGESAPTRREGRRAVAAGQGLGHIPAARPGAGDCRRTRRRRGSLDSKLADGGFRARRGQTIPDAGRQHVGTAVQCRRPDHHHQP